MKKKESFEEYRRKLPKFKEEVHLTYPDQFSICLNYEEVRGLTTKHAVIQIPRSWQRDGQLAELIREIGDRTGLPLQAYSNDVKEPYQQWMR